MSVCSPTNVCVVELLHSDFEEYTVPEAPCYTVETSGLVVGNSTWCGQPCAGHFMP